ncbi:hypothetical protein EC988_001692 [Linderina pennispora]|nr:hypothetical protein EC988_001692 [Linderina pennispora]
MYNSSPSRFGLIAVLMMLFSAAFAADVSTSDGSLALSKHGALTASGIVAGIVLIVIGVFFTFFGRKLVKVLIFLAGFCVVGGLTIYLEYKIRAPREDEKTREIVYLVVGGVLGLIAGGLLLCLYKVGIAFVGGLGGFALATWILSMKSGSLITSEAGRIVFIVVLIVIGMLLALFLEKPAIIVASAVWGSYALFVGIDCFAKTGFQDTATTFLSAPGATYETSAKVYGMIAGMAVTAVVGIGVQFAINRDRKQKFEPLP